MREDLIVVLKARRVSGALSEDGFFKHLVTVNRFITSIDDGVALIVAIRQTLSMVRTAPVSTTVSSIR
eukprot:m.48733 g.48733  ORF g.48733 m.48733 type:complete len:68 (+) comp6058_c0_seq1:256-459(+)